MAGGSSNLSSLHSVGILSNLDNMRKHRNLCDINLRVEGCLISAHKVVLSACSPYFKAMFTQDMIEKTQSEVTFRCIDIDAMETLIDFAYSGNLQITAANVQSIVPAACLLQMNLVIDECCQFLESQLHVNNCIGIWRFADIHGLTELFQVSQKFINQFFEEVSKLDEVVDLPVQDLTKILNSDDLNVVSEESVFEVLESWILWDIDMRKCHLPMLLKCVRLPLLSSNYLDTSSKLIQLIEGNSIARDMLRSCLQMTNSNCGIEREVQLRPRCAPKALCAVGGKTGLFATLSSFEIYLPECDEWRTMAPLPGSRYECSVVVTDRKLYVLGGIVCEPYRQYSKSVAVWDSEKNVWSRGVGMSKCRSSFGSVVLKGDIYVLGGYDGDTYLRHVEKLSPRRQHWERVPDMQQTRTCFSAAALHDCIYALGGYGPTHHDSVEMYDVNTGCWQPVRPMLNKRINFGVVVFNDSLYVMGGHSGTVHLETMEKYDRKKKEWTMCTPMPRRRTGIGTAVIDNKLYIVGGHSGHEYLNRVDCFDFHKEQWHESSGMSSARCNFGLVAL